MGNSMMSIRRRIAMNQPHIVTPIPAELVTFDTDMKAPLKKLKVKLEPKQDLHGYDKPWPAGGGKNLFDESGEFLTAKFINDNGVIKDSTGGTAQNLYTQHIPVDGDATYTISAQSTSAAIIRVCQYASDGFITRTLTAKEVNPSVTVITSQNTTYILINPDEICSNIQVEEGSTATAWTPYENNCPISGWTECEISRTNKVISEWRYTLTQSAYSKTFTNTEAGIALRQMVESLKPGTYKYGVSFKNLGTTANRGVRVVYKDIQVSFGVSNYNETNGYYVGEINIPEGLSQRELKYVIMYAGQETGGVNPTDAIIKNLVITMPNDTPTVDDVIIKKDISVSFPSEAGTVYGAKLNLYKDGTGDLVVDTISSELTGTAIRHYWEDADRDSIGFYTNADSWTYYTGLPNPVEGRGTFSYCYNADIYRTNNWWAANMLFTSGKFNRFEIRIPKNVLQSEDVAGARAYLNEHPLQVVYKIAPTTYHLTAEQISGILTTLKGQNNIWADIGDVELSYWTHTSS